MQRARRNRLANLAALLGLVLFSALLFFSLDQLSWPLGSTIQIHGSQTTSEHLASLGMLKVTVQANETVVPNETADCCSSIVFPPASGGTTTGLSIPPGPINNLTYQNPIPLHGVVVKVFHSLALIPFMVNVTDASGEFEIDLSPGSYNVIVSDWRIGNLSVPVQLVGGEITELNVNVNATNIIAQSTNIVDSYSSGWALGWEKMFMQLPTSRPLSTQGTRIYLDSLPLQAESLDSINRSSLTSVSIASSFLQNDSQWVSLQVSSPASIESFHGLSLLTLSTTDTVILVAT
jgi:hypothetical protein